MIKDNKGGIFFIINPKSGAGKATKSVQRIRKMCEKKKLRYAFHETGKPGDGSSLARKGIECGFDIIVAVGGDGTVNEVGRELLQSNVSLGIIPMGSGNGLARHLGIPINLNRALKRIFKGNKVLIDTGEMHGKVFLNVAGVGFDAIVSKEFASSVNRGWFNYLRIIVRESRNLPLHKFKIMSDEGSFQYDAVMMSFANSSQYGNNAKIAPKADIADGKVDVCVLHPIGILRLFAFTLRVMTGTVRNTKYFDTFQRKSFTLEFDGGLAHLDGDAIEIPKKVKIEIKPKSLYVTR